LLWAEFKAQMQYACFQKK